MEYRKLTKEEKLNILQALEETKNTGCPPEEWRVKSHTSCFGCNECKRYALMNSLGMLEKE